VNQNCRVTEEEGGEITQTPSADVSLNAYPNPTTGKATITFNALASERYVMHVTDLLGKIILSQEIISVDGINTQDIDLENSGRGMFIVTIRKENGDKWSKRIVVE
jgi:hypothetical protein